MSDVSIERRIASRFPMVLAVEVLELPRGAKFSTRTSDICRTGCYIDTLNPFPAGSTLCLRITHNDEVFEALGSVVYTSNCLGMGVTFTQITPEELVRLDRWLAEPGGEY